MIKFDNEDQAIKLYALADRYSQQDLCEECVNYLSYSLKENNVYRILDFAHQENIHKTKTWCLKFYKDNLSIKNMIGLIEYLGRQEDSEFKEKNKEFRNIAFNFILHNFSRIYKKKKESMQIFEKFLLKNIEMDTLLASARFLRSQDKLKKTMKSYFSDEGEKTIPQRKTFWEEIEEAVLSLIHKNIKTILASETPEDFLRDFTISALFMSPIESDIVFKIEGQLISAHKRILMEKSRYFEKVFNSGMAESKQDMIEIQDCHYDIFKGKVGLDGLI